MIFVRSGAYAAFSLLCCLSALAQNAPGAPPERSVAHVDAVRLLPNGMEFTSGAVTMRIVALRDDVLRITAGIGGQMPEDASWAVLDSARKATVSVKPAESSATAGFDTSKLSVRVDRASGRMVFSDVNGNVLSEDAAPTRVATAGPELGGFTVTRLSPLDEHYFGLGDNAGALDRREMAFTDWNTDAFGWQESTDPLYKSIPYFMAFRRGKAYGILLDNTWRTSFDFNKTRHDAYSFSSNGGALDYYFFYGPSPREVVEDYAWLTGTASLPPLWSLGYQQSRYSYYPEAKVREIAERLRKDRIPCDVIWFDIDYQDRNRPFTVDTKTFPDMQKLVSDLKRDHFQSIFITDLHIAHTPDDPSYMPYKLGEAQNAFVHAPDGAEFVGKVWPGASVFPDYTKDSARDYWGTLYKQFVGWGVAGFWNDMNEPSVFDGPEKTMPLDVVHRIEGSGFTARNATHAEIHNVYGMEQTRATHDGLMKLAPNERPFVMTRASYAGGQRYAVTWTGDNSATWNHLRITTFQLENLGLSGFVYAGADVGGFAGSPQMPLLTKWMEFAAFQPIDRDHTAKGTNDQEPWVGGPEQEAIIRKYIETRYKLLPYNYTVAEEASRTGLPMIRPLFLEFPEAAPDKSPLDLASGGEFLWGPDFLVAPPWLPDEVDSYLVNLPPGGWFDFWTGERMPDADALRPQIEQARKDDAEFKQHSPAVQAALAQLNKLQITPTIPELPVYVRAGSIIPMQPLVQSTTETPSGPLELRVYPSLVHGTACHGSVYQDDGHTLDYQRGAYFRQEFTCEAEEDALRVKLAAPTGSYSPWWKQVDVVVYGWPAGDVAAADASGKPLTVRYDPSAHAFHVLLQTTSSPQEVRLSGRIPAK